ncbi:PAS domain S-box protein [Geomonas sp.]|uniref:PAS domain S-box protein n=1 Tax=Geomonas sp. TaxID=2651584 RepID=UPI002B49CD63|nr:PAS domain S-box protein [Geomonas sp.]HJV35688.1 PAS domain S-box protein [Geomonas sp.]
MQVARSILLIEEDTVEAHLLAGMLAKSGGNEFSVQHVQSLTEGLDLLKTRSFDCILLDLSLPNSQGLQTALAVRKGAQLTPIVIVTPLENKEDALEALRLDIQDYLVKGDMNGTLLVRSICHSIERKRIVEELRESEERFASFMRHLPAAAWMKDMQGRYVYANAEAERVFATPLAALLGKSDRDLFPPETARLFSENDCRVLSEGGSLETTEVLRQADGMEHHSIVNKFAVNAPDGRPAYIAGVALDITERRQAEQALRESEEKFARIFDTVPVGITISTLADGRFVDINREGERLSGYRREEVVGHNSLEFDIWKDSAERDRAIEQLSREGVLRDREMMFRTKQDDILRGLFSAVIIDIGGKRHLLSIVSDITEQKRAEEALRLSEARYRALYRDNPTMIATLDAELIMLSVNPFCAHQLGYDMEELEGRSVLTIFHEEDRVAVAEQLRKCLENPNQIHSWQFRKVRKDGSVLWAEEMAQAVYDLNNALNVLVVCQDISERKLAEEALQKSERKFFRIFHAAPALIGISTLKEGRFIDINESALETLGYQRQEVIGRTVYELGLWVDETDRDRVVRILEEGGSVRNLEIRFRDKFGRISIGLYSAELVDLDGDRYMLSLVRDITARKRAEEEVERLNTDLSARAFELESANLDLEAFNYTVAHDLRQPLNVINGYCQAIKMLCGNRLDEECKDYLEEAYNGTLRMNQLIDALLKFSRTARVELHRETVDLTKMAQEAAAELRIAEPERRITFRIADGIIADGDANLLQVALANLIGNAWKYTGTREDATIEFGATQVDGRQAYFVRDNGSGFAMTDAEKLFTPFQRLPGAEKLKGFGIGLATVERIIRRHGGRIWAEGEKEKGATFYFTLGHGVGDSEAAPKPAW